jgi:hypothetical protein
MNIQFGSGVLYGYPNSGNLAANPTPYRFGVLQDAQVDFKGDLKKLYGQQQFAVAKARGKIDVTVKAKLAVLDPNLLNQLYFAQAGATGITLVADGEAQTVPAASPYTVTVNNAAAFAMDYGVQYAATQQQLTRLASGTPAQGQYTVSAGGAYTFAAADEGAGVLISYTYTSATRGETITLTNQLLGYAPNFRALLYNTTSGKFIALELFNCTASEISVPTKQEDFWIVDFNFDASVDATNTLGKIYADVA